MQLLDIKKAIANEIAYQRKKLIFLLKLLAIVFHIVLYCSVVKTNISPRLIDGKITINTG
jgi:hypothetical protein